MHVPPRSSAADESSNLRPPRLVTTTRSARHRAIHPDRAPRARTPVAPHQSLLGPMPRPPLPVESEAYAASPPHGLVVPPVAHHRGTHRDWRSKSHERMETASVYRPPHSGWSPPQSA